jgi:hypothetical protein
MVAVLLAAGIVSGCRGQISPAVPSLSQEKESAMIFESSADRAPPPEVPPVERDGVRYEQAEDGRDVGVDQAGGVLVATEAGSGKRLWTLAVYGNPIDPKLEADVQWIYFTRWPSTMTAAAHNQRGRRHFWSTSRGQPGTLAWREQC